MTASHLHTAALAAIAPSIGFLNRAGPPGAGGAMIMPLSLTLLSAP